MDVISNWFGDWRKPTPGTYDANGTYHPLVMGGGESAAANATAGVLRGNYENWKSSYFPKINDLMQQTTYNNPDLLNKEISSSQQQVATAFDTAQGQQGRRLARYGMTQDSSTQQANDRVMGLSEAASVSNASNQTRLKLQERNREIAAGGLPAAVSGG